MKDTVRMASVVYEIDRGIPLPPKSTSYEKYPFASMRVGDSFFVPNAGTNLKSAIKYRQQRNPGEKYTRRTKPNGIRVWRTA